MHLHYRLPRMFEKFTSKVTEGSWGGQASLVIPYSQNKVYKVKITPTP